MKRIINTLVVVVAAALLGQAAWAQEGGQGAQAAEPAVQAAEPAKVEQPDQAGPDEAAVRADVANLTEPAAAEPAAVEKSDADKAFGRDPKPKIDAFYSKHFELDFELLTLFQYANDTDFDRMVPLDDPYDRSSGLFGTFLKPQLTVKLGDIFRFYWEMELGLDLWSRNSADATLGAGDEDGKSVAFGIKQRQLYGDITWQKLGVRLGYQHIEDVSGLFLNHWFGAAAFRYGAPRGSHIRFFGGQMPDQTFEGWDLTENSLKNDVYVAGVDGQWVFNPWVKVQAGAYYLGDMATVGYNKHIGVVSAGVAFEQKDWDAKVAVVGQFGNHENAAADGSDATQTAWGVVASGGLDMKHFALRLSGTVLSADDDHDGNDNLAFLWSGKRPGMSILLSENETRDLGNNIDERIGSKVGAFNSTVAGIAGVDLGIYYKPVDYIKLGFVSAALMVLNPDNALGGKLVGLENELVFEASLIHDLLRLQAIGGLVVPGEAGSALVNTMNTLADDHIYFAQLGVILDF